MMKLLKSSKPNIQATDRFLSAVAQLMPALLSFGPFLMFMGIQGLGLGARGLVTQKHGGVPYLLDYLIALGGVLSLSMGLIFLLAKQSRIMQRPDELEGEKTPPHIPGVEVIIPSEGMKQ